MKKIIISTVLAAALLVAALVPTYAYTDVQERTADALNELQLFLGTGDGYDLDNKLIREQGITLLVRMLGKGEEAENGIYETPFADLADWATGYIGYAYENGITNGMGEVNGKEIFGSAYDMTDNMFLTLVLRVLGYSDKGDDASFAWDNPYALAKEVGLVDSETARANFTRGDAVEVFWNALSADVVGADRTLAEQLVEAGVFTQAEYAAACDVQKYGREVNAGVPMIPGTEAVEDTTVPTEDTMIPVEDTTVPVEDTTVPVEDTTVPVEDTTAPTEETTAPVEDTTDDNRYTTPDDEL